MPIRGIGVVRPLPSSFLMSAFLVEKKFYPGGKAELNFVMLGLTFDLTAPSLLKGELDNTLLVSAPLLSYGLILNVSSLATLTASFVLAVIVDCFEIFFESALETAFEYKDYELNVR